MLHFARGRSQSFSDVMWHTNRRLRRDRVLVGDFYWSMSLAQGLAQVETTVVTDLDPAMHEGKTVARRHL